MNASALAGLLAILVVAGCAAARTIPVPLPDHPGNVFLAGEVVAVPVAAPDGTVCEAVDYDGRKAAEGQVVGGRVTLGPLPVGWFEVRWKAAGGDGRLAVGVLERLKAPTPLTSPIGIDVAMAWFYKEDRMPAVANLCTLAGMNWVRDRLAWGEVEPKRGEFAPPGTKYDASARIQSAAALRVLQVNHSTPAWAGPDGKRFPPDLADTYRFHREMARRWAGQVAAFEPWNEADIDVFGGHTGAEMASFQKAAYLGLKAGNPDVIACLNVFATPHKAILADLDRNAAWPYFDTFNLHHYAKSDEYPRIYGTFRAAGAGRPLWVTEFSMPVHWVGDEKLKEPGPPDLLVQAERVPQVFAASLQEGPTAAFYFLLPHYAEGQTQFGILRGDLTPRPAFVALAAAGRLLADARPLGRIKGADAAVRGYVFRARPDGNDAEVLIAWAAAGQPELTLPREPRAVFDHLGRPATKAAKVKLTAAPIYILFPAGTAAKMDLEPPPAPAAAKAGQASPIVLQCTWPKARVALDRSAYRVSVQKPETVPLAVYNFSDKPAEGTLTVAGPAGWRVEAPAKVAVGPGERKVLDLVVDCKGAAGGTAGTVTVTGDFGPAGKPILSVDFLTEAAGGK